jgi:hypothetical protein
MEKPRFSKKPGVIPVRPQTGEKSQEKPTGSGTRPQFAWGRPMCMPWATHKGNCLKNPLNERNRSTNILTLCPSPMGRGNRKAAPGQLPLPLGEGWGEGRKIRRSLNRGTI